MNTLILHIPHASTRIPYMDGFTVNEERLEQELLCSTDWFTDELFQHEKCQVIKPEVSRLFCDMERFDDDALESMSKIGRGVLYTHCFDGTPLRNMNADLRSRILEEYYYPHHRKLTDVVQTSLNTHGKALILDCHSFPSAPVGNPTGGSHPYPDICIGTDNYHTPVDLLNLVREYFENRIGLTVEINHPYAGSIVPMEYYQKDKRVASIMIELNRRLYMDESTGQRNENFENVKEIVSSLLSELS